MKLDAHQHRLSRRVGFGEKLALREGSLRAEGRGHTGDMGLGMLQCCAKHSRQRARDPASSAAHSNGIGDACSWIPWIHFSWEPVGDSRSQTAGKER